MEVRNKYKQQLGDTIEKRVFNYVYKYASSNGVQLCWTGIFTNLYKCEAERIVANIEMRPELRQLFTQSQDFMEWSDLAINPRWESHNHRITERKITYNDEYHCGQCGEKKISIVVCQLRSLDEGSSTSFKCGGCGHGWVRN